MFGGQSSTPFGSTGGGFGQTNTAPAFGSPNPAPFGAPAPSAFGGFGAPAPAPSNYGGFGAPAPAPTAGFGGFGAPAPAPQAFGSSGFGAAPSSSPFGAPAPTGGGLFGSNPAPATSGLFGSAPAPALGGFGTTTSTFGGFGSSSTNSGFGSGGSTFGAPAPAPTGLFGSSAAPATGGFGGFGSSTSAFGSSAPAPSTGLFGAPAPAPSTGLFGSSAPALGGASGGTKIQAYQVTNRQDGTSSINLQAISAMPAYENKSFEELRFEDYGQGNRGTGAPGSSGGFGGFGAAAPAPTGGLFGAPSAAPTFGAPAPATSGFGGFGSPAPAPFGAPAPAPFGAPAPAQFGAPAPAAFGAPAPSSGFGSSAFGAKPAGGLFGAPAPSSGGLFGSSPAPASGGLFGSTPAAAPGGFGSPAPAPSLFGVPAPAPFGAPAPAPFGVPAPAPFGGFGSPAPAPSGGLFGAPAPSAFGGQSPGGGLFGAPAPAPGTSLFGAPKPAGTSLFGAPAPAAPTPFGFAAPAPAFGAPLPQQYAPMLAAPPVGSVIPPATDEILAAQLAALERNRKELEKSDNFRRKTSESSSITGASLSERESLGALAPIRVPYTAYRASPKSSVKVRPRGFASPEKTLTPVLSRLGNGGKPMATPDTMAASSATRLIINPSPKPKLKFSLQADQSKPSPLKITAADSVLALQHGFGQAPTPTTPTTPASPRHLQTPNGVTNKGYDYYQQVIGSPADEASVTCSAKNGNVAPTLTKVGYSCSPPIDFLYTLPAEDLAAVPNFSIERHGVGKIEWEGAVDIRGIDLDQVVVIEPKSASVYTKEEEENRKPSVGTKLNRAAIITLEGVYAPEATFESQEKFTKKVERQTTKMGAQLIDYDVTTGIWKLRVQHFSRYALDDDDDDSSSERKSGEENTKVHFQSGEREGRSRAMEEGNRIQRQSTPYKAPRVLTSVAVVVEDDDMDSGSDMEITEESKVLLEAEAAFAALQNTMTEQTFSRRKRQDESAHFVEEQKPALQSVASSRYVPTVEDIQAAQSKGSVCIRMATKAGIETSSIDFGKRLGRSFRVGWSPDGSFFCPNKDGNLVRRRPKFSAGALSIGCCLFYLEQHRANAMNVGNEKSCPEFALPSGDSLASVLSSYAEHTSFSKDGVASIAKQSFSLLKYFSMGIPVSLTETSGTAVEGLANEESLELRRLFAIHQWLKDSCSDEVEIEVKTALTYKDNHKALLAAISGGDSEKACKVADELEFYQLALMLAAGPEGKADILSEVMAWTDSGAASKMPDDLIRSYFLLGGDLKMEEDIFRRKHSPFDWRRRLVMSLTYGSKSTKQSVSFLVDDYNEKVAQGFAPFPRPHYLSRNDAAKIECVCYRLLHLGNHASGSLLRDIIDPRGYTYSLHDFSLSFHLAAAISAIGCSAPLSQVEEMTLIHGYAAQLLAAGMWEWAVYVLMCRLGQVSQSVSRWKQQRAKDLVLQNYRSVTIDRRTFLENVGVPSVWFDEALALQCATNGDAVGYLSYMVKVDPDEACASLEYTLIPNMFFMNKDDLGEARMVLDAFSVDSNSLAGAVVDFFHLYEDILLLEQATSADVDAAISPMLDRCEQVEQVFASYRSGQAKLRGPTLRIFPAAKTVPMASFLAEGLSQISLFKLQLRALQLHLSLSSTATQLLNLSQPNGMMDSGLSARENILRWLL